MSFIFALAVVWTLFLIVAVVAEKGYLDGILDWLDR